MANLHFIVGPNGAGKSTIYKNFILPHVKDVFINADDIQRDELKDSSLEGSKNAARIANERRDHALKHKQSFVTESVFSHISRLEILRTAIDQGFNIFLYYVSLEKPELCVARVQTRTEKGGHNIPEDKIKARYERNGPIIKSAISLAHFSVVFDNTEVSNPLQQLVFRNGNLCQIIRPTKSWVHDQFEDEIKLFEANHK